jgi:TPR repeat protein
VGHRAAEQGLPQAQQALGRLLREGRNIPIDKYHAYVWLLTSVELGAPQAEDVGALESDLGAAAVDKAKTEARELARTTARTSTAHGCTGWEGEFATPPSMPPLEIQKYCR